MHGFLEKAYSLYKILKRPKHFAGRMEAYEFINQYRVFFELLITLAILMCCSLIYIWVDRLVRLCSYHGLKYFRNAFFFYGIGFLFYFILNWTIISFNIRNVAYPAYILLLFVFNYTICVAGFYLIYSLVWKKFECIDIHAIVSRQCRSKSIFLHLTALLVSFLVLLFDSFLPLYIVQMIVHVAAIVLIFLLIHSSRMKKKRRFLTLYLIIMLIAFIGWVVNFYGYLFEESIEGFWIYRRVITAALFFVFLYGVGITVRKNDRNSCG